MTGSTPDVRELGRTFGEINLQEDGLEITEDRPMVLEWQKDKLKEYAKRIAANGGNPGRLYGH